MVDSQKKRKQTGSQAWSCCHQKKKVVEEPSIPYVWFLFAISFLLWWWRRLQTPAMRGGKDLTLYNAEAAGSCALKHPSPRPSVLGSNRNGHLMRHTLHPPLYLTCSIKCPLRLWYWTGSEAKVLKWFAKDSTLNRLFPLFLSCICNCFVIHVSRWLHLVPKHSHDLCVLHASWCHHGYQNRVRGEEKLDGWSVFSNQICLGRREMQQCN